MTTFKNTDSFALWLSENLIVSRYDLNAVLDDVERHYGDSASTRYELSSHETASGHVEEYPFEVEYSPRGVDADGDVLEWDLTIIF